MYRQGLVGPLLRDLRMRPRVLAVSSCHGSCLRLAWFNPGRRPSEGRGSDSVQSGPGAW